MPALAERTKIKKEWGSSPTTEGLVVKSPMHYWLDADIAPLSMDDAFAWMAASTRFVAQSYLPPPSAKAQDFIKKVANYQYLPANWDNNGAVAPEEGVISNASFFIQAADELDLPIYFIAPGPNGEIVIEYKNGNNMAEVFYNEDGTEEMILYNGQNQLHVGDINIGLLAQHVS